MEGQVDALVFAGGIGEKSALLRTKVVEKVRCLGFEIEDEKNEKVEKTSDDVVVVDISAVAEEAKGKRTLVCWTDEQVCISLS